jgi:hypothetical protein
MTKRDQIQLSAEVIEALLIILKERFEKNRHRHSELEWKEIEVKLKKSPGKLWSLNEMEITGGEPDVIGYDDKREEYIFYDCSEESPKGRRSICYDPQALESRKEHKPKESATGMASRIGIELLSEEQYHELQQYGTFDTRSSSWIMTPPEIREAGGAIFGDRRYGRVFIYHNGAESYYSSRGFRGCLRV